LLLLQKRTLFQFYVLHQEDLELLKGFDFLSSLSHSSSSSFNFSFFFLSFPSEQFLVQQVTTLFVMQTVQSLLLNLIIKRNKIKIKDSSSINFLYLFFFKKKKNFWNQSQQQSESRDQENEVTDWIQWFLTFFQIKKLKPGFMGKYVNRESLFFGTLI